MTKTTDNRMYVLDKPIAFYAPGAFYIKLNDTVIEHIRGEGSIGVADGSVFLHEYSHLVQDVTSLYGATSFCQSIESLPSLMKLCDGSQKVCVPLESCVRDGLVLATGEECLYAQTLEVRQYLDAKTNWSPDHQFRYRSHCTEEVGLKYLDDPDARLAYQKVIYEDAENGMLTDIVFGADEVQEAYAMAVEELSGFQRKPLPTRFSYWAATIIIRQLLEKVTPEKIIAICHWELQTVSPGVLFFQLLDELRKRKSSEIETAEQVFDCCRAYLFAHDYKQLRQRVVNALEANWKDQAAVVHTDLLAKVLSWHYESEKRLLFINDDLVRRFPLDTALCDNSGRFQGESTKASFREGLRKLFAIIPLPHVEDQKGAVYSFGAGGTAGEYVFFLRALSDIIENIWWKGMAQWACSMKANCHLSSKSSFCDETPWKQGMAQSVCPYGAAAKYLKLHDKELTTGHKGPPPTSFGDIT